MKAYVLPRIVAVGVMGLLSAGCGQVAGAQQTMPNDGTHNMADMQPVPPPEQLPVPRKMAGIGNSHIAITAKPEAQMWFDQGLSLLHDFWDYESEKAFEQAIRVDADCAMCWWGLAEAEGFRHSAGRAYGKRALAEATKLKDHSGTAEKLYIEAAQTESDAKGDDEKRQVEILRKLVKESPADIEAKVFLAEAVGDGYDDDGDPKEGQKERIAILESVMKNAPNDSAANHYWIHAIEPGNHPELALKSAALLASLAPTSGHMVHMPGHIYYRVGNYSEAEHWFKASMDADERYMHDQQVSPDDVWNYVHNMMYAIANLMEQGRLKEANELSDHLAAARGKLSNTLYIWSARDQMARLDNRLPVVLRLGDWDAVLTMLGQTPAGGDKMVNLRALTSQLTEYATGMKALDAGDAASAQLASDRMDAALWRFQQRQSAATDAKARVEEEKKKAGKKDELETTMEIMPDALSEPLLKSLSIESLELRAGILVAKGKLDEGKKLYADAAREEKKLGYHEPPMYIRPVGETEAAELLRAKDYAGATEAYQLALKERPSSGFGLYGLAHTRELAGDTAGARAAYTSFLKAWPAADRDLPEVRHAREVTGSASMAVR